jgi:hypothetical protein
MRSTQEWLHRRSDVNFRFRASNRPQIFGWMVGSLLIHSRPTTEAVHIKRGITSFDTSRRTPDCPAMMPRGPGNPPLSQACSWQLSACNCTRLSRYNSPWPSSQSQPRIQAINPRSRPTGRLFTRKQPCSMPQPTQLGRTQ